MGRRRAGRVVVAISVIAGLAAVAWAWSHHRREHVRVSGGTRVDALLARGVLMFVVERKFSGETGSYNYRPVVPGDRLWLGDRDGTRVDHFRIPARAAPDLRTTWGFSWHYNDSTAGEGLFRSVRTERWAASVPIWLGIAPGAIACGITIARRRRRRCRRQQAAGRCPACGYDLRATPERCPECGTARSKSSRNAAGANPSPPIAAAP